MLNWLHVRNLYYHLYKDVYYKQCILSKLIIPKQELFRYHLQKRLFWKEYEADRRYVMIIPTSTIKGLGKTEDSAKVQMLKEINKKLNKLGVGIYLTLKDF